MSIFTPFGLWIDDHPRTIDDRWWNRLLELPISTIAIMIDSPSSQWFLRWDHDQIEDVCQRALENDIEVVLTTWPLPCKDQIDAMCLDMAEILKMGAIAWEIDCEHLWRLKHVRDFQSLSAAGLYMHNRMREITVPLDVRLELTTHTGHRESGPKAMLSPLMDRVLLQLYSTRYDWKGKEVPWASTRGPGTAQERGLARGAQIPRQEDTESLRPVLGAGMAFWGQKWPNHTVGEALNTAITPLLRADLCEIRGWSSKWIIGSKRRHGEEIVKWLKAED